MCKSDLCKTFLTFVHPFSGIRGLLNSPICFICFITGQKIHIYVSLKLCEGAIFYKREYLIITLFGAGT